MHGVVGVVVVLYMGRVAASTARGSNRISLCKKRSCNADFTEGQAVPQIVPPSSCHSQDTPAICQPLLHRMSLDELTHVHSEQPRMPCSTCSFHSALAETQFSRDRIHFAANAVCLSLQNTQNPLQHKRTPHFLDACSFIIYEALCSDSSFAIKEPCNLL